MLLIVPFLAQKRINHLLGSSNRKTDYLPYNQICLTLINTKMLRKCEGELEHAIKCRCVEPCSTEDYINAMEDIITRKRIGRAWTIIPMEPKMVSKTSREDKRPERPVLKCHKCGRTSNLANT
ncbi:hypothetical protein O181_099889 [Austropuccinia psidii MF-1]|uniref:Uncharacterized protein n=1 Tax=Austropuccinia psidii MF-1 TaxID=1389203 RepID=A0A9Q3JDK0_9BASI|nr:hypothetical protein [Austropuccinia psidii MF-1]